MAPVETPGSLQCVRVVRASSCMLLLCAFCFASWLSWFEPFCSATPSGLQDWAALKLWAEISNFSQKLFVIGIWSEWRRARWYSKSRATALTGRAFYNIQTHSSSLAIGGRVSLDSSEESRRMKPIASIWKVRKTNKGKSLGKDSEGRRWIRPFATVLSAP